MVKNIHIQINEKKNYTILDRDSLVIDVYKSEPFDQLSKIFNKYTHKPKYEKTEYVATDYLLCLDDPNASYYTYIFYYNHPEIKITSVDIFFASNDSKLINPLVFGFNQEESETLYYTYWHLINITYRWLRTIYQEKTLPKDGSFGENDLLTRLFEEKNLYEKKADHILISTGLRPEQDKVIVYPDTGLFSKKVEVKKSWDVTYFAKFEHKFFSISSISGIYINFEYDTLLIYDDAKIFNNSFMKWVEVYYFKARMKTPFFFAFRFHFINNRYLTMLDFREALSKSSKSIKTSNLRQFNNDDLAETLKTEFDRMDVRLTYLVEKKETYDYRIDITKYLNQPTVEFFKVVHKPEKDYVRKSSHVLYKGAEIMTKNPQNSYEIINEAQHITYKSVTCYFSASFVDAPQIVQLTSAAHNVPDQYYVHIRDNSLEYWTKIETTSHTISDKDLIQLLKEPSLTKIPVGPPVPPPAVPPKKVPEKKPAETPPPPGPSAPPSFTPPTHIEEPQTIKLKIDLSKTSGTYESGKVQLDKKDYKGCDLFCYCTHYLKDSENFSISSFLTESGGKEFVNTNTSINLVKSVIVYFNTFYMDNPILIGITTSDNVTNYYKNIVPDGHNFSSSNFVLVQHANFTQKLIEESDRVNKTLTYQLEMSVMAGGSLTYGYQKRIQLIKTEKTSYNFTLYTHEPYGQLESPKSFFLFNQKLVDTKTIDKKADSLNIQNKTYKNIKTYFLNTDMELPLIMELVDDESKSNTSVYRKDGYGAFWENKNLDISSDEKIESLLYEINYPLKQSVIIELNKNEETEYEMRLIDNTFKNANMEYAKGDYKDGKVVDPKKNIKVNYPNFVFDHRRNTTDYKFLSHKIPESIKASDISGIRIFMTQSSNAQPEEIELYQKDTDASQSKNKLLLHYPTKSKLNRIYGYFHSNDSRPLLLSYDRSLYKRLNVNNNSKWIYVNKVSSLESYQVFDILKGIHVTMKKKLTFLETGNQLNIATKEEPVKEFKRVKFMANTSISNLNVSFTLPKSEIIQGMKETESINKLLDGLSRKTFDSVSIYYQNQRNNLFLFEFIDESIKTHFHKVDQQGKYWISKNIEYTNDSDLGSKLDNLKTTIDLTAVYEIDKTNPLYNNRILVFTRQVLLESEFTKYTHSPSDGKAESSFIMYRNEELKIKQGDEIVAFSKIKNKTYINTTVYFGTKAIDKAAGFDENIPLVIELFDGGSDEDSRTYYKHRRDSTGQYWDVDNSISTVNADKDLITLLKQTEFDFLESIVILTNLKNTPYGEEMMNSAISKLDISNKIFIAKIDNTSIRVAEEYSPCLYNTGFKFYYHYVGSVKSNVWYGLRIFVQNNGVNSCSELTLYDIKNKKQDYLFHKQGQHNNKVCVFFYEDDPRPLLVSYGNDGFIPDSTDHYHRYWFRFNKKIDIDCGFGDKTNLLEALSKSVGLLNEVQLQQHPYTNNEQRPMRDGPDSKTYDLQTFNGQAIKVKVKYRNMNCYRAYKHEPIGTGFNKSDFRLGSVKYKGTHSFNLEYDLTKELKGVTVYYSLFDVDHDYPLLVILQFTGNDREFYELNDHRNIKWQPVRDKIADSDIEYSIKKIVDKLGVQFNKTENVPTLFDRKDCHEDSNKTTIIAATSSTLGTVATGGTIVGVTAATRPEWFIPVIRALV